jgi:hypothetical protein
MNCFYHPSVTALGTCKSCSKGLCHSCTADLGKGIACLGKCEKDVLDVIRLIERNIQLSPTSEQLVKNANSNRYFGPIFQLLFGLFFLGIGASQWSSSGIDQFTIFLGGMGFLFFAFGLITGYRALKVTRAVNNAR